MKIGEAMRDRGMFPLLAPAQAPSFGLLGDGGALGSRSARLEEIVLYLADGAA
jgi:hypothetical protein